MHLLNLPFTGFHHQSPFHLKLFRSYAAPSFLHKNAATVEPLYKDTPEMRTSPLIRTLCMAPAT